MILSKWHLENKKTTIDTTCNSLYDAWLKEYDEYLEKQFERHGYSLDMIKTESHRLSKYDDIFDPSHIKWYVDGKPLFETWVFQHTDFITLRAEFRFECRDIAEPVIGEKN